MHKSHTIISLLLHFCFLDESFCRSGPECDDDLFYAPYVKVLRKRNGANIDSLDSTGFIDLSRYVNAILCINGPAVLLSNYEKVLNGTTNVTIFSSGEMIVYNHKCMKINKVPAAEIKRLKKLHALKRITADVLVVGIRAVGVHLVGEEGNYKKPTPAWFRRQNYGHDIRKDKIVTDGSFAIIGIENTTYCLRVENDFNVVLISKAETDKEVCSWSIKNIDDRYERYYDIFRKNRSIFDYEWQDCNSGGGIVPPDPGPDPVLPPTSPIVDPFSIISPHGPRPPQRTTTEATTQRTITTTTDPDFITDSPDPPAPKPPAEILVEYTVELNNCLPFPLFTKDGCIPPPIPIRDSPSELMNQVLAIEPKQLDADLKWKSDILDLISEIFGKICEPFPPDMAYTVNRVLEYYLVLAHEKGIDGALRRTQIEAWKVIINDLQICNKKISGPIFFDWTYQDLNADGDSFFRRRRKRSLSHKLPRSKHTTPWTWYQKKSKRSKKRSQKSHKRSKSRKSSRRRLSKSLKPRKRKDQYSMEFLEQLSLPISHNIKRAPLVTVIEPSIAGLDADESPAFVTESINRIEIHDSYNFQNYPEDVYHVNHNHPSHRTELFYYEDDAEIEYDLNVGIDIAWKIWAVTAGYCNQHYESRESETFPRFYNTFYEDFMAPVEEEWKYPFDNSILKVLLSGYNSDVNGRWLDTCIESSYIDSNTNTFRPPRPLVVGGEKASLQEQANSFLEIPLEQYDGFHNVTMSNFGRTFNKLGVLGHSHNKPLKTQRQPGSN